MQIDNISASWIAEKGIKFHILDVLADVQGKFGSQMCFRVQGLTDSEKTFTRNMVISHSVERDLIIKNADPNTLYQIVKKIYINEQGDERSFFVLREVNTPSEGLLDTLGDLDEHPF